MHNLLLTYLRATNESKAQQRLDELLSSVILNFFPTAEILNRSPVLKGIEGLSTIALTLTVRSINARLRVETI